MRSVFTPRLRQSAEVSVSVITNNKQNFQTEDLIMENKENKEITPELKVKNERSQFKPRGKQNRSQRSTGVASSNSSDISESKRATTTAFNMFYPGVRYGNRHKYSVSHYEINLSPTDLLNASVNPNRYNEIETSENITSVIKCGGPEFHRRVMMAAVQANAKFLVTTGTLQPLVNAFYGHMYNSRILYSLLCTAWRCQNQVNVIDEDQLYFSPMLNDHEVRNLSQGWNDHTFARETDATTFTINTVRQAYCFSNPTSNGVWANSIVTPILQYVRLTRGWMKWIEEKFMRTYVVDPTDFNVAPRFVEFWPSGAGVTASGTEGLEVFSSYQQYGDEAQRYTVNATIQDLVTYINTLITHQARFVADYPQLELMWEYLHMTSSVTNFSRDLDAKSLPVVHSYSISKMIESCAAAYGKYYNQQGISVRYYFQDVPNYFVISRDPVAEMNSFKTFEMASSRRTVANITYLDRVELDEGDFAICSGLIAPLSYSTIIYNSQSNPFLWVFPLCSLLTYNRVEAITPLTGTFNNQIYNFVTALGELNTINAQQGPVLSRIRARLYGYAGFAIVGSTELPALTTNATSPSVPYYDLKDYVVPNLEATGWRDSYADMVLTCE